MSTRIESRPTQPARTPSVPRPEPGADGWRTLLGVGIALAMIGWGDVVVGLVPPRLGNPDWEFGAISGAVDAMPLATLGSGMVAAALVARGRRLALNLGAAAAWLVCVAVLGAVGMLALSAPLVWRAAPGPLHTPLAIAMGKTAGLVLVYLVLYAWLGVHCRRAARRRER